MDRDGNDKQALKTAIETLVDDRFPLTIFPEGNVYLMNDRVMPFVDGAAYIAARAARTVDDAPVPIADFVGKGRKLRDSVRDLTARFEQDVQAELDAIAVR